MQAIEFNIHHKEDLIKLLKSIKNDQHFIASISDFLCMFRPSAKKVAEVITAHFNSETAENKVLYFYLCHEVITRSKDSVSHTFDCKVMKGIEFVMGFGDVLYAWVENFTL